MHVIAYIVDPTLGHVARAHRISACLSELVRSRIVFITPDERAYVRQILEPHYEVHHVPMDQGSGLQSVRFAEGLEPVLERLSPDLIVHDLCPLRYLGAARLTRRPRVHITNAFLTGPAAQDTFQSRWFTEIGTKLNAVRHRKGLEPLTSAHELYEADLVLCADPDLVARALPALPPNYRVCGHIGFEVQSEVPPELRDARNLMLLSMGSTGPSTFSAPLLRELRAWSGSRRSVYVGRRLSGLSETGVVDDIYEWLPLQKLLGSTRLVVTQGGTGSSYQALSFGRPLAVLPLHRNHEILGRILQDRGVAILCSADDSPLGPGGKDFDQISQNAAILGAALRDAEDGAACVARNIAELLQFSTAN